MVGSRKVPVQQLLRSVPLFRNISQRNLQILAAHAERREVSAKQLIFTEGDRCTGLHIIVYGRVKMSLQTWNGVERPIQIVGPGCGFGDIIMFRQEPYYRNVRALEDSLLVYLPLSAVRRLIETDHDFTMQLLSNISEKVRGIVRDIESFSLQPPVSRLITYLMRLLPPTPPSKSVVLKLEITKTTIAAQLNVTPETLSRQFRELTELGLVSVKGRTVTVYDVEKLGKFVLDRGPASDRPRKLTRQAPRR